MRLPDWQERLAAVVRSHQRDSFEWGRNDCCLFVCDVIQALLGFDPAAEVRGLYLDLPEAAEVMREHFGCEGVSALAESIAEKYGFVEVGIPFAQRGDIALSMTSEFGPTVGICLGKQFAFASMKGLIYRPPSQIERIWRVA